MTAARAYLVVAGGSAARRVAEALRVEADEVEESDDPTSPQSPEAIRKLREQCRAVRR